MSNVNFDSKSLKIIQNIAKQLEDQDLSAILDIDINNDVLNISTLFGIYVINKNSAVNEIWLASPVSGPHHFKEAADGWFNRNKQELLDILNIELNKIPNLNIKLSWETKN